jgi:hypothetical protein
VCAGLAHGWPVAALIDVLWLLVGDRIGIGRRWVARWKAVFQCLIESVLGLRTVLA